MISQVLSRLKPMVTELFVQPLVRNIDSQIINTNP